MSSDKSFSSDYNDEILAIAQVGIQLGQSSQECLGVDPIDDELAALYDNRLNSERRAEVLSHIANNTAVYQRWIRCVESATATANNTQITQPLSLVAMWKKFKRWFKYSPNNRSIPVYGSGLATAAVLVVVITIVPFNSEWNTGQQLDHMFDDWGRQVIKEWQQTPKDTFQSKSNTRSFSLDLKTDLQRVIDAGFKTGAIELGTENYAILGLETEHFEASRSKNDLELTQAQYQALLDIGRFTAMTILQCEAKTAGGASLQQFYEVSKNLVNQLRKTGLLETQSFINAFDKHKEPTAALCAFTQSVAIAIRQ